MEINFRSAEIAAAGAVDRSHSLHFNAIAERDRVALCHHVRIQDRRVQHSVERQGCISRSCNLSIDFDLAAGSHQESCRVTHSRGAGNGQIARSTGLPDGDAGETIPDGSKVGIREVQVACSCIPTDIDVIARILSLEHQAGIRAGDAAGAAGEINFARLERDGGVGYIQAVLEINTQRVHIHVLPVGDTHRAGK